ncbi:MAG: hypothetical protein ABL918_12950 [Chakrabartia sp.]
MGIDGENDGMGAAGSAADLLGTGGAASADAGQSGAGDQGAGDEGAGGGDEGAEPDWYANLSADGGEADNPSNRDWIKGLGVKDIDGLAKIARDNQRALRESGRVKIPGADAKPEEVAEFRKALGVPDDAKGYAMPEITDESGNAIPLNTDLMNGVFEDAHAEGVPKAAMDGIAAKFVQRQLDMAADHDNQMRTAADKWVKDQGNQATEKLAAIDRAASALGVSRDEMIGLRNAWGAEKALSVMAKLGEGMAEDVMIGGGKGRFGISGAEAQAEMDKLKSNPEFYSKATQPGTAENARWNRLQNAAAAYADAQAKAA